MENKSPFREQVWSSLRGHRRLARAARKRILERQISEDAQVEQDESLTRNTFIMLTHGAVLPSVLYCI
jgi:hypothetical protein